MGKTGLLKKWGRKKLGGFRVARNANLGRKDILRKFQAVKVSMAASPRPQIVQIKENWVKSVDSKSWNKNFSKTTWRGETNEREGEYSHGPVNK